MEMTKLPSITMLDNPGNEELREYLVMLEGSLKRVLSELGETVENTALTRKNSEFSQDALETLRDGLIKVSTEVKSVRDSIKLTLENNYIAKNEIGVYAENAVQALELDGKGITQYFSEIALLGERLESAEGAIASGLDANSELDLRISEINAYIRTGRLDTGVYGIEIGNFRDGDAAPCKVRLSENRLSFYIGNTEAAYFSDNSMVIANAGVLEALKIGGCIISPDEGITFVCSQ